MSYEKKPEKIWLESAYKALEYLANSRKNTTNIPADHWALLATNKLLSVQNKHQLPISNELLINHAIQICESILKNQINNPSLVKYHGGFTKDGRTTPTATRLEGLQAALNFIQKELEIWNRIQAAINPGISFLHKAPIKEGKFTGAFPRVVSQIEGNSDHSTKFNKRSQEIRIDYIQHVLGEFIQFKLAFIHAKKSHFFLQNISVFQEKNKSYLHSIRIFREQKKRISKPLNVVFFLPFICISHLQLTKN